MASALHLLQDMHIRKQIIICGDKIEDNTWLLPTPDLRSMIPHFLQICSKQLEIIWLLIVRPYVPANRLVILHELIHGKEVLEEEVIQLFDQKIQRTEVRRLTGPYRPLNKNSDMWLTDGVMNGLVRILTTLQSSGNGVIFTDTYYYTKLMQLRSDDPTKQGKFNCKEVKKQCKNARKKIWGNFLEVKSSVHTNSFGQTTLAMRSYFE